MSTASSTSVIDPWANPPASLVHAVKMSCQKTSLDRERLGWYSSPSSSSGSMIPVLAIRNFHFTFLTLAISIDVSQISLAISANGRLDSDPLLPRQ